MKLNSNLTRALNGVFEKNIAPYASDNFVVNRLESTRAVAFSALQKEGAVATGSVIGSADSLRSIIGKTGSYSTTIGAHPDFSHLKEGEEDYGYCTSVFVDLKGSTLLARKLSLPQVKLIKNGLIKSAIEIFQAFDGHIQRLQGDAVFALFCRKGGVKEDSIIDAINATSILQAFIQDALNPNFIDKGLPEISARIGIDFGDDTEVMWSQYGLKDCNEITTTSLHTDLAAKLQAKAPSNGIMIGDNVRAMLDLPDEFYEVKEVIRGGSPTKQRYAIKSDDYQYKMWSFRWHEYLRYFTISRSSDEALLSTIKTLKYTCKTRLPEEEKYSQNYLSGCGSLPKETQLLFKIDIPREVRWNKIKWSVENRGSEAIEGEGRPSFEMEKFRNKTECLQSTAYLGHHYMRCQVFNGNKVIADARFGVFVRAA